MRDQLKRRLNIVKIFAIAFAVAVIMLPRKWCVQTAIHIGL